VIGLSPVLKLKATEAINNAGIKRHHQIKQPTRAIPAGSQIGMTCD